MASADDTRTITSGINAEHERLRSAVVEAAQKWCEAIKTRTDRLSGERLIAIGDELDEAVDALNKFEASIGQKEGE